MGRLINVSIVKAKQLHGDYETVGAQWLLNTERAKGVTVESGGDTYIRYAGATNRMSQSFTIVADVSLTAWNAYVAGAMTADALVLTATKKNGKDYSASISCHWSNVIMGRISGTGSVIYVEDVDGSIDEYIVTEAIAAIASFGS